MQSLFSQVFLPITLAIITLGMGLSLTDRDFKNLFLHPKAVITGLCCQIFLLPLIAFLIARSFQLEPEFQVGLMIIAACPGGATSNLITYLLRGNVALSISMTALNSLITLVTIPVVVTLSIGFFIHQDQSITMNVGGTILRIFLIIILPAFVGTRIRKSWSELADNLERPLRIIMPLLLLLIYAGVLFIDQGNESPTIEEFVTIIPFTLLLNVAAMGAGFLIARIIGLGVKNQYTIAVEVGLQNSGLAILVALTILDSSRMTLVPLVYGSITFFSTLLFGWLIKKLAWKPGTYR